MSVCIIDCYSDEPAGLGVPPYIGTTPRYVFGAVERAGSEPRYVNIDDVRALWGLPHDPINLSKTTREVASIIRNADLVVILGGIHTPGRYLRGRPGVPREIRRIVSGATQRIFVGGPIAEATMGGGRALRSDGASLGNPDEIIAGDPEAFVYEYLCTGTPPNTPIYRTYEELDGFATAGSRLLGQMRVGPDTVCEVETSRGCSRSIVGGCSFCSECSRYGLPVFREASSIVTEIWRLRSEGALNIRLGRQACFFSYESKGVGEMEIPVPNPAAIESLLSACSSVKLNSFHIDNVNPAVVAKYPEESECIVKSIVRHCTPGNVAALGIETADPLVLKRNNLKTMPEDSLEAIQIICRFGSEVGWNGQPMFLPGVNFVLGLPGETKETYRLNSDFLKTIIEEGLLLRRINIRKVVPVRGTRLWGVHWRQKAMLRNSRSFVDRVRSEIDRPMLRAVYPVGRKLRGLVAEIQQGATTFCRFPGSYPIVVGVEGKIVPRKVIDGIVVDHGYRSLTALRYPVDINKCRGSTLVMFPGIGQARSARIIRSRPIKSRVDLERALGPDPPSPSSIDLISRASEIE